MQSNAPSLLDRPRLGINIDHVATLRQLRFTPYPHLLEAAQASVKGGADLITVHLREDRRHIQDDDVKELRKNLDVPLNLEMAASPEMTRFAIRVKPDWICLVPEKRKELTTEGGLHLSKNRKAVSQTIQKVKKAGIRVSCFIEPSLEAVKLSAELGADAVEFHTGAYCRAAQGEGGARSAAQAKQGLEKIKKAALLARKLSLQAHAGHGFDYENIRDVVLLEEGTQRTPLIEEYNIGHAVICRAVFVGLERAVREMVSAIYAP